MIKTLKHENEKIYQLHSTDKNLSFVYTLKKMSDRPGRGNITHLETQTESGRMIRARIVSYPISLEPGERYGNSDGGEYYMEGPYCCKWCKKPLYVVIDQGDGDKFEQPAVLCGQAEWDTIIYCEYVEGSVCSDCISICNYDDAHDDLHTREVETNDCFTTVWGYRGSGGIDEIRVVDCDLTCRGECLIDFSKRHGWIDPAPPVKCAEKS